MDPAIDPESVERTALSQQILSIDERIFTLLRAGVQSGFLQLDLSMSQLKVLLLLMSSGRSGLQMSLLAQALRVTTPTATGIIDRLVQQNLAERLEDQRDRRLVLVKLTNQGRDLIERLMTTDRQRFGAVLARLGLDELRTVAQSLDILYEALLAQAREAEADILLSSPTPRSDRLRELE